MSQAEARATSVCPLIAMHCANWQVNLHWQNQRGWSGIGRTNPSGHTVAETLTSSGSAGTAYIRDEMLRAYFRYQGRCYEINRPLNKSHARACINGVHGLRGSYREMTSTLPNSLGCKANSQCDRINKLPFGN